MAVRLGVFTARRRATNRRMLLWQTSASRGHVERRSRRRFCCLTIFRSSSQTSTSVDDLLAADTVLGKRHVLLQLADQVGHVLMLPDAVDMSPDRVNATEPLKVQVLTGKGGALWSGEAKSRPCETGRAAWSVTGNKRATLEQRNVEVKVSVSVEVTTRGSEHQRRQSHLQFSSPPNRFVLDETLVDSLDKFITAAPNLGDGVPVYAAPHCTPTARTASPVETDNKGIGFGLDISSSQAIDELGKRVRNVLSGGARYTRTIHPEVMFFPDPSGRNIRKLLEHLSSATRSLDVCVYTITDNRFRDTLVGKHEHGVKVRVISDWKMTGISGSDVLDMRQQGLDIRLGANAKNASMHHKFAIIDGEVLLTGSFNWTQQASRSNLENVIVSNDRHFISSFSTEFDRLWYLLGRDSTKK